VVEDVKTKTLIRELTEQVKLLPAASPEAQKVNSIIEMIKYDGLSAAIAVPENKAVILKIAAASAIAQVNVQTTAATHSPEAIRNNLDKSYQTQNTAQNSTSVKEMFSPTGATTTVTPKQYSEPVQDRTIRQESTTPATEDKTVAQATGIKSNSTSVKPETSPHPNLPQQKENAILVVGDKKPSGPCGEFCRCAENGAMKQSTNAIQDPAVVHRQVGTGSITIEAKQDGGMTIARTGSDGIVKHQTFSQEVILQSSNEATAAVSLFKEKGLDTRNISNDVLLSALNVKSFTPSLQATASPSTFDSFNVASTNTSSIDDDFADFGDLDLSSLSTPKPATP